MNAPVEPKVLAAGTTAALSGAALWLLQHYVFKGTVPDGVASMVYVFTPAVLASAAGWLAPHQSRTPANVTVTAIGRAAVAATEGVLGPLAEPSNVAVQPPASQP